LLRARGGCWFQEGTAEVHVGVERDFQPAKKAHPALAVDDPDALAEKLEKLGYPVTWDNETIPGRRRFHTADGHGNRIEIV
jgi:predicted enzyme related to lactoylglutathione lyase